MKQSAHKSVVVYEKEDNLVKDVVENLVSGNNIESEVHCMSSQTVNKTCVLGDVNGSDLKHLKYESEGSQGVDYSLITFPVESHGNEVSDQEMKEDINLLDAHFSHESLVVYKEDRALVESEVQVDADDSEMGAVIDSNGVKSRLVEFESNVINMDEITSGDNGHSLADQRDLIELETELLGGENTNFVSDDATAAISRIPLGETRTILELKDTNVTVAESVKKEGFDINRTSEITRLKSELENFLKKAEK
ncbi:uncharacterized protein LOC120129999 [Hibiscus syriacus]|uniref:uncharacterized protein LOC120129999 n=1 Tax=Hibiscus syriacus TaxID=106335 RepID=UPI00192393ED|nr:uncharacterized protein LOC120129999 [Hibiscus syriacus]